MKPGLFAGNPKHPFFLINAWSHSNSVTVSTDPLAIQLVEDLSMKEVGHTGDFFSYEFFGKRTGEQLAKPGLPSRAYGLYWIQELVPNRLQVLYADQKIARYEEARSARAYAVRGTGKAGKTAILIVYDDTEGTASKAAVSFRTDGRFTWEGGLDA